MAEQRSRSFSNAFRNFFNRSEPITDETWDDLESALITATSGLTLLIRCWRIFGVRWSVSAITEVKDMRSMLRDAIAERLSKFHSTLRLADTPAVVLVVGVNGVGKTTTIGKFAKYLKNFDKRVIVGAADAFRAAAVEQLATWAERGGADIVKPQQQGQDPASVAYQTVQRAIDENFDIAIIHTAGRLQTKGGLMDELGKIKRVVEKLAPISEVLLVLDATTGQNGLAQAQAFIEHAEVSGLVLTKIDGSAKGGFVLSVQQNTGLPVKLVGEGEGIGDLTGFTPHVFAQQLVG